MAGTSKRPDAVDIIGTNIASERDLRTNARRKTEIPDPPVYHVNVDPEVWSWNSGVGAIEEADAWIQDSGGVAVNFEDGPSADIIRIVTQDPPYVNVALFVYADAPYTLHWNYNAGFFGQRHHAYPNGVSIPVPLVMSPVNSPPIYTNIEFDSGVTVARIGIVVTDIIES